LDKGLKYPPAVTPAIAPTDEVFKFSNMGHQEISLIKFSISSKQTLNRTTKHICYTNTHQSHNHECFAVENGSRHERDVEKVEILDATLFCRFDPFIEQTTLSSQNL
jgi:hypothetical protein